MKAAELAARDPAKLEEAVRSEERDFPERIASLLPPPEEKFVRGEELTRYDSLRSLCELYLTATPSQREFIRSLNVGDSRDAILNLNSLLVAARAIGANWSEVVSEVAGIAGNGMVSPAERLSAEPSDWRQLEFPTNDN